MVSETGTAVSLLLLQQDQSDVVPDKRPNNNTLRCSSNNLTQVMPLPSRDQNVGRNHNVRIDNSAFERVEECK